MKYLKRFNEGLEGINPDDIDDYLIDFLQLGFTSDIKIGSSLILDFSKLKSEFKSIIDTSFIPSYSVSDYTKGTTSKSLTIELRTPKGKKLEYDVDDVEEAYDMLCSFLNKEYGLIPNYIILYYVMLSSASSLGIPAYFENFDKIRKLSGLSDVGGPDWDLGKFKAIDITLGFYQR